MAAGDPRARLVGEYAGPGDDFDRAYERLSTAGACDVPGGAKWARVKLDWLAAGQPAAPAALEDFIRDRANIGPTDAPTPVSLLVVTDWNAGLPLATRPPLPDVEPGEAYVTEYEPQRLVVITEVLVEGFTLAQISTKTSTSRVAVKDTIEPRSVGRLYRLHQALTAGPGESVRLHLHNDSKAPLKQKIVTIVKDLTGPTPRPFQRTR